MVGVAKSSVNVILFQSQNLEHKEKEGDVLLFLYHSERIWEKSCECCSMSIYVAPVFIKNLGFSFICSCVVIFVSVGKNKLNLNHALFNNNLSRKLRHTDME